MIQIHSDEANSDGVAQPEHVTGIPATQHMGAFVVFVVVIVQSANVDETLNEPIGKLDEEPVGLNAADITVELASDLVLHELNLLQVDTLALCFHGEALSA
jgi:hypothetical protein